MKLLIKNVSILTMQEEIIENGFIGMEDGKIAYLGTKEPDGYESAYTIEGKNHVALPPLINAHTHSAMVLMRNYADDRELFDWLENAVFPVENRMEDEDVYWASMLAAYEMIKSGTACFADMYFSTRSTARAVAQSGLRANLNICVSGDVSDNPDMQDAMRFFDEYHNAENGRILVSFAPHAIYTCSAELLQWCANMAAERGVRLHTHVAETRKEYEDCMREHGVTPTAYLNQLGVFDVSTIAAHSLYLNENDLDIYRRKGVTAVYNPTSNCKLASGINAIDRGQYEAAMSLGVGYRDMMKDIILPQAVKHILPSLVNEAISLLKESSILSYIGAVELLRAADQITVLTFRFFEPYLVIALIYYVFVMLLSMVASRVERWVNRSDRVS